MLGNDEFGSGLGLSIVKTIVDRLGAGISLGESPGGGLDVTVTIPQTLIRNPSSDRSVADARGLAGEQRQDIVSSRRAALTAAAANAKSIQGRASKVHLTLLVRTILTKDPTALAAATKRQITHNGEKQ